MKISVKERLANVKYLGSPESEKLKSQIEEFLVKEISEKHSIQFSDGQEKNKVNLIKHPDGRYGYAFGCSKFDEEFKVTLSQSENRGEFRYKDTEIQSVLKKAIHKFDLAPTIEWGRGMGVFVFNIFLKDETKS